MPFGNRSVGIGPRVGGVVESRGVDNRPVEKITPGVVRILIYIKDIRDGEFSGSNHQPVDQLRSTELVSPCFDLFGLTTKPDGLPDEHSWQSGIRIIVSDFVSFPARKAGDAERRAKAKPLIDFRIDPKLGALPQP